MKFSTILLTSSLLPSVFACGFARASKGSKAAKWRSKRSELLATLNSTALAAEPEDSNELLGDLVSGQNRSPIGNIIADLLLGKGSQKPEDHSPGIRQASAGLGSEQCRQDTCCVWKHVADEMYKKFRGSAGRCNNFARGAIRLGFHDAGAWKKGLNYGGADGGILLTNEINRLENRGLEEIAAVTKQWYEKYNRHGASMADLIQMGATVATVTCPLGPRIRSFVGRKDNPREAANGLLPDVNAPAQSLVDLFRAKTIKAHGLTALIGAHSTSQQRFVDPERALDPQDSTPGVWDVKFYSETLSNNPPKRVFKFASDVVLSQHRELAAEFRKFASPGGQDDWNEDFAKEYIRLSLLGVDNINRLTECTKVLPEAIRGTFRPEDQYQVDQWANGGFQGFGAEFGALQALGELASNITLEQSGIDPSYINSGVGSVPKSSPRNQGNRPEGYRGGLTPGGGIPRPTRDPSKPKPTKAPSNPTPNGPGRNDPPKSGGRPNDPPKGNNPNNGGKPNEVPKGSNPTNNNPKNGGRPNEPPKSSGPNSNNPKNGGKPNEAPKGNGPNNNNPKNGGKPNEAPKGNGPNNSNPKNGGRPNEAPKGSSPNNNNPNNGGRPNPPKSSPPANGGRPDREPPAQKAAGGNQQPKFGSGSQQPSNNGGRPGGDQPRKSGGS